MKNLFSIICLVLLATNESQAATVIETFQDWTAFEETEGQNKVCFIASAPTKPENFDGKRGAVNFIVAHRPAEKALNVVSFNSGYPFKEESEAVLTIGAAEFKLFTAGFAAWAYDAKDDAALVKAMRGGAAMAVRGAAKSGTTALDTFSLNGFSAALDAINKACGLK